MGNKRLVREWAVDILYEVVGAVLFGVAIQMFIVPNKIAPGGVSAVAVVLNYAVGGAVGAWSFALNIPIMYLAWRFLGRTFFWKTMVSLVIFSLVTDGLYYVVPPYTSDPLLASLAAGALSGVGFGLVFMRGSTSGGIDVLSRLVQLRYPHISVGRALLAMDVVIIVGSAIVFGEMSTVLYSVVTVFVSSKAIDSILYGMERGKMVYIMTRKSGEISKRIIGELDRSCTILTGIGGFTNTPVDTVLVAVRVQQYHMLKTIATEEDPSAFIIVTDATQVFGEGFLE